MNRGYRKEEAGIGAVSFFDLLLFRAITELLIRDLLMGFSAITI